MTNTIKTVLSLKEMPQRLRVSIPLLIPAESRPLIKPSNQSINANSQSSTLTCPGTNLLVRGEPGECELSGLSIPSMIEAVFNIPQAVTGQDVIHGTSVFAAGLAALYLQRNWLANAGVPREQLDSLTTSDVDLSEVSITFILSFPYAEGASALIDAMISTGQALYGKRCIPVRSGIDKSVILPGRDFTVTASIKSDFDNCYWSDSATMNSICQASPSLVRIDAKLEEPFLKKYFLTSLDRWRSAYEKGKYEKIFNATVRKTLRLTDVILRHEAPPERAFHRLTSVEAEVLRGYLARPALDPRKSQAVIGSRSPEKRFYELRRSILKHAHVDIEIPWKEHVKIRCMELDRRLVYPGDFHPAQEHAPWTFCESNWAYLQDKLNDAYEVALQMHSPKKEK